MTIYILNGCFISQKTTKTKSPNLIKRAANEGCSKTCKNGITREKKKKHFGQVSILEGIMIMFLLKVFHFRQIPFLSDF